jgi:hypothetical protein
MKKKTALKWLFGSLLFLGVLLLLVFVFSLMPYTVADPVTAWQTFVEFCQEVIDTILANKVILGIIAAAIYLGGYLLIVKTTKK